MQRRLETLFEDICERSAEEQASLLREACGVDTALREEIEGLLRAHEEAGNFMCLDEAAFTGPTLDFAALRQEERGERIGNYELLEQIGEGTFGTVWMAEQQRPVRRRVALKVIKLGMDTKEVIARFEQERQALAMMDHPNIAKVFDAGATRWGRPFFVMEMVEGVKITEYCDQARLPIAERLALFIQVCLAVQHAHQKGIIHRDLKPSNILVAQHDGRPVPKVIDFGVAKATEQRLTELTIHTQFEQLVGTPLYMSPEQAEIGSLDIDTQSDIYSLGVLLYELLTGQTPFGAGKLSLGLDEIRRAIRELEPPTPSTVIRAMAAKERATIAQQRQADAGRLAGLVRGDLDWIVVKALEKDRARRYTTANGLAADVQRHLANEPVAAGPPGRVYRLRKFMRRNRLALAAAGVVAAVLVVGAVVSTWQAIRATRAERAQTLLRIQAEAEKKNATTEAARSAQVAEFMQGMLKGVGPGVARGRDTKLLREIMDKTAARLDKLKAQPEVEADLRDTLGVVYRDLAEYSNAEAMHRRALALRKELHGEEDLSVAVTLNKLGELLHRQGKFAEAENSYRQALAMQRRMLGNEHLEVARTLNNLGPLLRTANKLVEAESILREALAIRRKLLNDEHPDIAASMKTLGGLLQNAGKLDEAEGLLREALARRQRLAGADRFQLVESLSDLGGLFNRRGKWSDAEPMFREVLTLKKEVLPRAHPEVANILVGLGESLRGQGKPMEAEPLLREAVAIRRKLFGNDQPALLFSLKPLTCTLYALGQLQEAETFAREAWSLTKTHPGSYGDYWRTDGLLRLFHILLDEGKVADAFREVETSSDVAVLNKAAWALATSVPVESRDGSKAVFLAEKAAAITSRKDFAILDTLAAACAEAGQFENAISAQKEAIALLTNEQDKNGCTSRLKLYEAGTPYRASAELVDQTTALLDAGRFVEAELPARRLLAFREQQSSLDWQTFSAKSMLGSSLLGQKKYAEAEPLLVAAGVGLRKWENQLPVATDGVVRRAIESLVQLYETTARPGEAAEWKAKLAEYAKTSAVK